ncbi:Arm DNA-binding domain-containing protein [Clostridium perfringens]
MASYNQISKGNWQVVISLGNDPVTKKRIRIKKQGFKTKKEAEKFVNEYSSKVDKGFLLPKSKDIYLKDFILDWFYNHKVLSIGIFPYIFINMYALIKHLQTYLNTIFASD